MTSSRHVQQDAAARKKRGRPARLSREMILMAALELLKTTDARDLTLTAIAKSLHTVPMSLYNHVRDLDDIMAGVAERVLADLPNLDEFEEAGWQDILTHWMSSLSEHLSEHPQAIQIFAYNNQVSAAWMGALSPVIRALRKEGLDGAELVMATSWVAESCAAIVLIQASASIEQQRISLDTLHALREKDRREVRYFMQQQRGVNPEDYLAFCQQRMLDSVAAIIEGAS